MKPEVLVITGPTATGKTKLAVMTAKAIGGEVVGADSMQIYRHMDIGTAKPTLEEMEGIPHHMIDVCSPFEDYSVSRYVEEAAKCCEDIISRGNANAEIYSPEAVAGEYAAIYRRIQQQ